MVRLYSRTIIFPIFTDLTKIILTPFFLEPSPYFFEILFDLIGFLSWRIPSETSFLSFERPISQLLLPRDCFPHSLFIGILFEIFLIQFVPWKIRVHQDVFEPFVISILDGSFQKKKKDSLAKEESITENLVFKIYQLLKTPLKVFTDRKYLQMTNQADMKNIKTMEIVPIKTNNF